MKTASPSYGELFGLVHVGCVKLYRVEVFRFRRLGENFAETPCPETGDRGHGYDHDGKAAGCHGRSVGLVL